MKNAIKKFLADEQGAETIEWVMIAAILATIIIATFATSGTFGAAIKTAITRIVTALTAAV